MRYDPVKGGAGGQAEQAPHALSPGGVQMPDASHYKSTVESRKSLLKSVHSSNSRKSNENISFDLRDNEVGPSGSYDHRNLNLGQNKKGTSQSISSAKPGIQIQEASDDGITAAPPSKGYNVPTVKILNPELYKQSLRKNK